MTNIKFPFYKFSREELLRYNNKRFMPNWIDNTEYFKTDEPTEVIDPQGKKWNLDRCLEIASGQLEFGNPKQIGALKALDFFNYLFQAKRIPFNERRVKVDFGDEL